MIDSFNDYFSYTTDKLDEDSIEKILNDVYAIIYDWVINIKKKSYTVEFKSPLLCDSSCIATSVLCKIQGDVKLADIKKDISYLPEHIIACDSVSIVSGCLDELIVIFSDSVLADKTDVNSNCTVIRFMHHGNSLNTTEKSDTLNNNDFVALDNNESHISLPSDIQKKIKFCNDVLGVPSKNYIGYKTYESMDSYYYSDWASDDKEIITILVNGEPDTTI